MQQKNILCGLAYPRLWERRNVSPPFYCRIFSSSSGQRREKLHDGQQSFKLKKKINRYKTKPQYRDIREEGNLFFIYHNKSNMPIYYWSSNKFLQANNCLIIKMILFISLIPQFWNPSIYNIIRWFAGPMGQTTHQPSIWCSKYYFFFHKILQNSLQKSFPFLFFYDITKKKF